MLVLAIDTAIEACSVAIFDTERQSLAARASRAMARGHADALLPMVASVMDEARVEFTDLARIAVTTGPGSFTGLRVGISAARAVALAADRKAYGLSTLAAFAAPHIAADSGRPVAAAIDARHGHVYLQVFGAAGRTIFGPRIASLREAADAAGNARARLAGTAAMLVADSWTGPTPPAVIDQQSAPDIEWVARLGAVSAEDQSPPKPLYLRTPDTQPQDAARLPRR
jgi:tRNA threonylcarbamoyl adenosine modification protein YeaZ